MCEPMCMHGYRNNQMIYHVTGSGFLRKFRCCGCIVPAVVVMAAVAAAGVAAGVSSGAKSESDVFPCPEKRFSVICRLG